MKRRRGVTLGLTAGMSDLPASLFDVEPPNDTEARPPAAVVVPVTLDGDLMADALKAAAKAIERRNADH